MQLAFVGSLLRHALTALSGMLIAKGVSEADATAFVSSTQAVLLALLTYAVGQGWSLKKILKHGN